MRQKGREVRKRVRSPHQPYAPEIWSTRHALRSARGQSVQYLHIICQRITYTLRSLEIKVYCVNKLKNQRRAQCVNTAWLKLIYKHMALSNTLFHRLSLKVSRNKDLLSSVCSHIYIVLSHVMLCFLLSLYLKQASRIHSAHTSQIRQRLVAESLAPHWTPDMTGSPTRNEPDPDIRCCHTVYKRTHKSDDAVRHTWKLLLAIERHEWSKAS